ncbi:MAG: DUF1517 domain-containing protein [Cyanobacteria bacterium P01_C01_bin.69]
MSWQSKGYFWHKLMGVTASSLALGAILSGVGIPHLPQDITTQSAYATTSGGRTRGGGFGDDTPPPSSSDSDSSNDNSNNNGSNRSSDSDRRDSRNNNNNRNYDSTEPSRPMNFVEGLVLMTFMGIGGAIAYKKLELGSAQTGPGKTANTLANPGLARPTAPSPAAAIPTTSRHFSGEITNNIVTITQLQVAMVSEARHVQQTLNQIAAETDMGTPDGLTLALRETVVTLLRSPETWTHAIATSKTVNTKQEAKQHFEALSIDERSKFDVESMANIDGKVTQKKIVERAEDVASHIVVTLIVGTAHDSAVIDTPVMSGEELRSALKRLGSITLDYLMVYEVLWSPQDESDSLTDEELLLNYPKMFQL